MTDENPANKLREKLESLLDQLAEIEEKNDFEVDETQYTQELERIIHLFIEHSPEKKDELMAILAKISPKSH